MQISVALWSHPRSLSTAFERSFIERGDFAVFHEAFSYVYYVHEERTDIPHKRVDPSQPRTYPEIKRMMETARLTRPVFHKDFPYHALDHLLADPDYLRGQVNTFLIRNPAAAVPSHLAVHPDVTREALGYAQLWELFEQVRELTGTVPVVIDADRLLADPYRVMARYCERVGIRFVPDALRWSPGPRPEWASWEGWHRDVMASTGLTRRRDPVRPRQAAPPTPHARDLIDYCRPYYQALLGFDSTHLEEVAA